MMKTCRLRVLLLLIAVCCSLTASMAQERRPVDARHPLWFIHVDVWYKADPQKIIDLIPEDIRPYVCMNLSLSCGYDTQRNVYKMPQNAIRTYKSWATVCQKNGMWFTCQPASGGHTHIQDDDLETFEYFYRRFPNFLGWNYAEQFWGFDEPGDRSSSSQATRIALFAKLVPMAHKYGGFLTISFCGNIWSHALNPMGMMKRNADLLQACRDYPEAILWLYKYTTSSCFYNNESVTWGPYVSGLARNYGVRYDNCGWNGALDGILGENHGKKYPASAGIGTVMEQMGVNGAAVWDGPELTWREECFHEVNQTTVNGYNRRNWEPFKNFRGVWTDMFRKVLDGTIYIPTREEIVGKTRIVVINDKTSGSDEEKYATWGSLYDGLYKQADPFNRGNGQWMDNYCYFKKTGRYGAIPMVIGLYDDLAKSIPVQVKRSNYTSRWGTQAKKVADFNEQYPEVSEGDLYVNRYRNQLVTYTPYTYLNKKKEASARIPLRYNTCDTLELQYGKLGSGLVREYADHIDFYLNNYRNDTTTQVVDKIIIRGAAAEPTYEVTKRTLAAGTVAKDWDAEKGVMTLTVSHNGPFDITVNCAGKAENRDKDQIDLQPLTADLPRQPEAYQGEVIVEAEDMDFKQIKSCVTDPYNWYPSVRGHAGNGFADMGTNTGGSLRHQLTLSHGGDYRIAVRYTSPNKGGELTASVNGSSQKLAVEKTATNEWRKAVLTTTLQEGSNELILTNKGGLNMYVDQVIYTPVDEPAERFLVTIREVAHGRVTANVAEAAEGEQVLLSIEPDEGYALTGWRVVHGDVTVGGDGTFTMPDDNVTLVPEFTDMSIVYRLDLNAAIVGTIPEGWRCVQENGEVHEYSASFSMGARMFSGFTGFTGKALYWREDRAEYGRQKGHVLTLKPGNYRLSFAMAAWKGTPKYKASILSADGNTEVAASAVYTAKPNANGNGAANLSSAESHEMTFAVTQEGDYVICFTNESRSASGLDEYLLLACNLNTAGSETGIAPLRAGTGQVTVFDAMGVRRPGVRHGLNIIRQADGTTKKVIVR